MPNNPLDVRSMKAIHYTIDSILSVGHVNGFSTILFDTVAVAVTLASTLGTWAVYKPSTWNKLTLTHLMAQQSESCSLYHHNRLKLT